MRSRRRRAAPSGARPTIVCASLTTPVGPAWVAVSDRGVCRLSLGGGGLRGFEREVGRAFPGALLVHDDRHPGIEEVRRRLAEWFDGARADPGLSVDLRSATPFQRRVLEAARGIPAGRVLSYGDLARRIGAPGAARAVGGALSRNPVPILIPCHRVVGAGGSMGGYTIGRNPAATETKLALLAVDRSRGTAS